MADFVFNIAKGEVKAYCKNVKNGSPANSRLIAVPIEATGVEADAALKDHDTLQSLLAGSSNEQTTLGRKTIAAADLTITVDDSGEKVDIDMNDLTWAASAGNAVAAVVICYDPDNTAGTDADLVPLTKHDFAVTPDGSDIVAQVAAGGFFRAS